jgi:hypothetical protein
MLLPVRCPARRADGAGVIGQALALAAAGQRHRPIAEGLGRPAATVRGWLRRAVARAGPLRSAFTALACGLDPRSAAARSGRAGSGRCGGRSGGGGAAVGAWGVRVVAGGAGVGGHHGGLAGARGERGAGQRELPLVSRAVARHPSVRMINPVLEGSRK